MKNSVLAIAKIFVLISTGLFAFQNCSQPGELTLKKQEEGLNSIASVVPPCSPSQSQACSERNGHGIQFCSADGQALACELESCNSGFQLIDKQCVPRTCQPGSTASCASANGTGSKTCNSSGTGFGACVINACDAGFNMQNGACVANLCTPNSNMACVFGNGSGNKVCSAQGTGYGACVLSSCNSGYNLQNGTCVANVCTPNSMTSCSEGNGSGTKTCNSTGTGFGACQLSACNSGYNLQNGTCVANLCNPNQKYSCSENNGSGEKTCNAQGTGYGACQLSACNDGYNMQNGSCVANVCTPNSTAACSENNGSGSKKCNAQGSGYGSCQISSCNAKYVMSNGVCLNTCFSNIVGNGKADSPYQIKNETDLLCMNRFGNSNVNTGDNYWQLKANLNIGASTYPVVGEVKLRGSEGDQFILVSQFSSGNFDGGYHTINYTVKCSLESNNCKNPDGQSYPKKDISVFGVISNSTVSKLKIKYDYSDIGSSSGSSMGRAIVQYASGLTLDARKSRFFQISTEGVVLATPQCASGLTSIENYGSYNPGAGQENLIEQSYVKITALGVGSGPNYITSVAAFSNSPNFTTIKNSYADVRGALKTVSNGTTNGFGSGIVGDYSNFPNVIYAKFYVQNSYVNVDNADSNYCLPSEFSGSVNSVDLSKNTVLTNSFWVGPVACDKRSLYPGAMLPLSPSEYSSAIQNNGWDASIWVNGNLGLPQLRWLGQ